MQLAHKFRAFSSAQNTARNPVSRRTTVHTRCQATRDSAIATNDLASTVNADVSRRSVVSLLFAGAILLPARPGFAEEEDLAPAVAAPEEPLALEPNAELLTQASEDPVSDAPPEEDVPAVVEEVPAVAEDSSAAAPSPEPEAAVASAPTKVFMDVTINGEPAGRLTVELFPDVSAGASRFAQLAAGRQGVDYRLSKFNGVLPTYVRNDGLSRLSYSATEMSPIVSGDSIDALEAELDRQTRHHDQAGLVSLVVREREARPVKERLVARDGKLITVLEQAGEAPNGTQFTITTAASPELDATNLIIGRLVEGEALLRRIAALPVNRPRNDNPYFQAGKAMGDKRAVTAERAFYRPFQKVVVSGSGILS